MLGLREGIALPDDLFEVVAPLNLFTQIGVLGLELLLELSDLGKGAA